jgi:hypothetical protein
MKVLTWKGQEGGHLQRWVENNPGGRAKLDVSSWRVKPFGITLGEKMKPSEHRDNQNEAERCEWIVTTNVRNERSHTNPDPSRSLEREGRRSEIPTGSVRNRMLRGSGIGKDASLQWKRRGGGSSLTGR